jgi:tetratricopeptide (TPR) repeat protein
MSAGEPQALADAATAALDQGEPIRGEVLARRAVSATRQRELAADDREGSDARQAAWRALGTAQRMLGQLGDAEASFHAALAAASAADGQLSLEAAVIHNDLGMTYKLQGRFAEAAAAYDAAGAILAAMPDADPDDLASLWHNRGGLAHAQGDHESAEPLAKRAIEVRTATLGPDHVATLLDRSAYAAILDGLGRVDEAELEIRDVVDGLVAALGEDHPEVAVARNNLAATLQRRGCLREAERLYRLVVAAREARLGTNAPALAVALSNLGTVLRAQGRPEPARAVYERAIGLLEGVVDESHPTLETIRLNLARVMPP